MKAAAEQAKDLRMKIKQLNDKIKNYADIERRLNATLKQVETKSSMHALEKSVMQHWPRLKRQRWVTRMKCRVSSNLSILKTGLYERSLKISRCKLSGKHGVPKRRIKQGRKL